MRTLIISLLSVIMISGCMHNNGDIGNYFGTWKVSTINVDGVDDPEYKENIFFQFQSDVFRLVQNRTQNDITEYFGTWSETYNIILLQLNYKVNPESEVYQIPPITRLIKGDNIIAVKHERNNRMIWTFSSDGQTIIYNLKKQ
ncbi:MAG: hypothetical protein E7082_01540 [Bacteroidales bacterium]|nr:hypothetical protein [Bacteroidales bacterium]